jgi:hypothetical protein
MPPDYLAQLPYSPLPDYFVAQKLQEWNTNHFGKMKVSFSTDERRAHERQVLEFMAKLKNGTPLRLVLRNGSGIKGTFSGVDQDDLIWIRPDGLGGFISHRSYRSQDVASIGVLN